MSAEHVPRYGKADVAFAGAELKDAWLLIGSVFAGLVLGSLFGWVAYLGLPALGYFGTKAYIGWKGKHLPGYFTEQLYRIGVSGYSSAFNRKNKLFIGDGKVVNPSALQMGAIVRAAAVSEDVADVDTSTAVAEPLAESNESQLVN
jgi:hypothetical protein